MPAKKKQKNAKIVLMEIEVTRTQTTKMLVTAKNEAAAKRIARQDAVENEDNLVFGDDDCTFEIVEKVVVGKAKKITNEKQLEKLLATSNINHHEDYIPNGADAVEDDVRAVLEDLDGLPTATNVGEAIGFIERAEPAEEPKAAAE